jgi:hypothetical protein
MEAFVVASSSLSPTTAPQTERKRPPATPNLKNVTLAVFKSPPTSQWASKKWSTPVNGMTVTEDSIILAEDTKNKVNVIDKQTSKSVQELVFKTLVTSLVALRGSLVAIGFADGGMALWEVCICYSGTKQALKLLGSCACVQMYSADICL